MIRFFVLAISAALLTVTQAAAQEHPTYQSLWDGVAHDSNCSPKEYADFILVWCPVALTFWYFTKPNHPAHPGVIQRVLSRQPDGSWSVSEHGSSFASDAAQPAFKAWLAQIADLDRQMREHATRQHATPQAGQN